MYLIVLCIFILKLEPSFSKSEFPEELFRQHLDLQKVGEVIFNNEKYNILRPTTHIISDYFKDYMLRRDNKLIPSKRVFVDDNSFRHFWSGFDKKTKSLRKTEILTDAFDATDKDNVTTNAKESKRSGKIYFSESNLAANRSDSNENISNKGNSTEGNAPDVQTSAEKITTKSDDIKVKEIEVVDQVTNDAATFSTSGPLLREGGTTKAPAKDGPERSLVKTTFFCPFFGVITMAAFVD